MDLIIKQEGKQFIMSTYFKTVDATTSENGKKRSPLVN